MSVFYKATRPDAMSFHTDPKGDHVLYAVGATIAIPEEHRAYAELCTSSVLHASDTPSETLVGGSWPCRLFEVTGTPVAGPQQHKYGFFELHVEREIEAWRALGPNGQEIAAYIEALKGLDEAVWAAARSAAWSGAWSAARLAAWSAVWDPARGAVWDVARGTALALCVRDLISDEHFATLYAPWEPFIPADSLGPWETLKGRVIA